MFTAIKATEIEKQPRKGGGGTNRYQGLARAVGDMEIGQAIPVLPENLGVEADMTNEKDAERFRSNVSAAMNRLVGKKLNHRHRVVVDVHGVVMVERTALLETSDAAPATEPDATETDADEIDDDEGDFDEV